MTGPWPERRWSIIVVVIIAAIGGALLAITAATFWMNPGDSFAYWIAGERLMGGEPVYATGDAAFAPYAYHYTPPLAQVLAPLTLFVPAVVYLTAFRVLLLLVTWDLAGRRFLPMLALIAFLPVVLELRFENVNLLMAAAIVYGLGRFPWLFSVAAIVKISPGLGIVYLVLRRRWRDALIAITVGTLMVVVSFVLDPRLWGDFIAAVRDQPGSTGNSLVPLPYVVRALIGLALAVAGGMLGRRRGELLLVAAITIANPNLALNGFAVLAAAVPIWFAGPDGLAARPRRDASA